MWAGYLALANQQAVLNGNPALGFINPEIYSIGLSSSYTTDFHDITQGNNGDGAGLASISHPAGAVRTIPASSTR